MENFKEEEVQEVKLIVTEEMRGYFYEMAKWCKWISYFGFFVSILLILLAFSVDEVIKTNPQAAQQLGPLAGGNYGGLKLFYIIFGLIYLYPSYMLSRFANKVKFAVLYGDQESLNSGVSAIYKFFKFIGMVTLIGVALYFILMFVVAGSQL